MIVFVVRVTLVSDGNVGTPIKGATSLSDFVALASLAEVQEALDATCIMTEGPAYGWGGRITDGSMQRM
jgi:hypothetical protein